MLRECEELQDKPAPRQLALVLIAANVPLGNYRPVI